MTSDFTGDYELVKLDLTTATGDIIGLRFVMLEISWYECAFNNQITLDLLINDANNLIMNLPLFGYETLDIAFKTPGAGLVEKTFRLHRITDRGLLKEREMVYILHFVTPEAILNLKTRVSKSYRGYLVSDIVADLHNNLLGGGIIDIEPTKLQHHIIIPNLYPVHAINWLSTRAISANHEGANYLYYQDKDMFRFVSMESRLQQPSVKTYLFQVANVRQDSKDGHKSPDLQADILAAEAYTFDHHSDILDNMKSGMYGNQLIVHSQQRKLWKSFTFDYAASFDTYKHLYPGNRLDSKAKSDLISPASKLKLHGDGRPDEYPAKPEMWIPARISQLQQLVNVKLTITIPGDSERTVGQVVEFNLPSPEQPVENKQIDDKYYMGRYLISSLRHKIDMDKFVTVLELVKDSVQVPFP